MNMKTSGSDTEPLLFLEPAEKQVLQGFGAGDRGRTDTVLPPLDFESSTSAYSITPAEQ